MKTILILLVFCSCASTEKLLLTKPKYQVRDIEAKRFEVKQIPLSKEWRAWSLGLFAWTGIVILYKE